MTPAWQVAEVLVSLAAGAAVTAGILRRNRVRPGPWTLVGLGLLVFALGDFVSLVAHRTAAPGADLRTGLHLLGYLLLVAGLILLRSAGDRSRDWAALVDAAIIATTAAFAGWLFLVAPALPDGISRAEGWPIWQTVLDTALVAVGSRLLVSGPVRSGLLPARPGSLSVIRLAALAITMLIPPALVGFEALRGRPTNVAVLSAGMTVLVVLVMVRVGLLMQDVAVNAARERTLRAAAVELVTAGDRAAIHAAALRAVHSLVGGDVEAVRIVDVSIVADTAVVVGAGQEARVRGSLLTDSVLSRSPGLVADLAAGDPRVARWLGVSGLRGHLAALPVRVDGDLLAVLVVVTGESPNRGVVNALETLVAQLALALESASLAADLHDRQSEARFRALVQNSSDAILLVDAAGVVTYQSATADRMFGYHPDELVGSSVEMLCHRDDLARLQSCLNDVLRTPFGSRRLEVRLRCKGRTWLDSETVVDNLQEDPNVAANVVTVRDISERKRFEEQLRHQAFHDELTGLANRALFTERVAYALGCRERSGGLLAVLMLDLDDFKTVNDGLGHAAGDAMLRAVAERLTALVRPGDTTARLGGDEFAMALVDLPSEEAAVFAVERIHSVLAEPLVIEGKEMLVQASIGLAFADDGAVTPEEVLRNADAAMYVVKSEHKGRYAVYEPHMHAAALHRLDLRTDLSRALDNSEFRLYYQPIVSMTTDKPIGVEALVRWAHPQRGLVNPDAFIPLAEETGLIVPLGQWVLEEACRQLVLWSDRTPALTMSVNVSQRQLRRAEFGDELARVLTGSGVDPGRLTLEITESAVMADAGPTVERLHALRDTGVRLAVDDFGTGYSSFSWLRQLPVDVLKIDKEFVDELGRRQESGFLVGAIIDLAHNLGLRTVAEGIERPNQLTRLREMHCDLGQGFHVGRPMPPDRVIDLLAREQSSSGTESGAVETSPVVEQSLEWKATSAGTVLTDGSGV